MPFTVSHVIAVLPIRASRVGAVLATAPLVLGSMAPDAPSVVGALSLRDLTHGMTGALTVDVAITAAGCGVWALVLRPVVADLVPELAARWAPLRRSERAWPARALLWYLAAAIGCVTHVVWDAFTHAGGPGRGWIPLRHVDVWIFETLQLLSSVVGLAVLLWWSVRWWRTHSPAEGLPHPGTAPATVRRRRMLLLALGVVLGATAWAAVARVLHGGQGVAPERVVVDLGFGALAGALVGALVVAVVYRLAMLRDVRSA